MSRGPRSTDDCVRLWLWCGGGSSSLSIMLGSQRPAKVGEDLPLFVGDGGTTLGDLPDSKGVKTLWLRLCMLVVAGRLGVPRGPLVKRRLSLPCRLGALSLCDDCRSDRICV